MILARDISFRRVSPFDEYPTYTARDQAWQYPRQNKLLGAKLKASHGGFTVQKSIIIMLPTLVLVSLTGCKWQDDFRNRQQPQILEQPRRPTLNIDSVDYEGDPLTEQTEIEENTPLPCIDGLHEIPEIQEAPGL